MSSTRIKICGITRPEDALHAESLGVDALGFVFVAASKRVVSIERAVTLSLALGPFIQRVGLFLNPTRAEVEAALTLMPDLTPQFHGQESPEFCNSFARPYLKAIGVASGMPGSAELDAYENASGFLFDSNAAGELGGTGHTFDWSLLREYSGKPLILAGGIGVDNVTEAVLQVRPYAIDVSTGVEASKGIKSPELMSRFVSNIRLADSNNT